MRDFIDGCVFGLILGLIGDWWLFVGLLLVELVIALASPADAHCYSLWRYPWPQRCGVHVAQAEAPTPPSPPDKSWFVEIAPDQDIPLPSLEHMEFPPDCLADWCERLKGVGMLRDKLRTN